jgi:hypothetical protein
MYDRILKRMREKIRTNDYVMTTHAEEEMDDDGLTIFDIERGVLTGEIVERNKEIVTAEWKYTIKGKSLVGDRIGIIGKISITGKLVLITVCRL